MWEQKKQSQSFLDLEVQEGTGIKAGSDSTEEKGLSWSWHRDRESWERMYQGGLLEEAVSELSCGKGGA